MYKYIIRNLIRMRIVGKFHKFAEFEYMDYEYNNLYIECYYCKSLIKRNFIFMPAKVTFNRPVNNHIYKTA